MRQEFLPSTLSEDLRHHLENTTQGCKPLDEYLLEMKQALQRAGEDDPTWMKYHFMIGLKDQSIIEAMLLRSHNSLDELFDDVLMEARSIKEAEATRAQEHVMATTHQEGEHEDDSTKVASEDKAFSYDGGDDDMTEHGMFPSVMAASEDVFYDALSEDCDDAPHQMAYIFGGVMDEEVEHGIFPST